MLRAANFSLSLFKRLQAALVPCALSVFAGYVHACSVATPWGGQPLWWLQMVAMAGLVLLLLRAPSAKAAALRGWLFATTWLTASTWWLYISMHTFGGLAAPLAALAVLALSGFLALYYAAACAGSFKIWQLFGKFPEVGIAKFAIIFASSWLLAELARDTWFTGFPWAAVGYAYIDTILAESASVWGVYGVGWAAVFVAASVAASWVLVYPTRTQPMRLTPFSRGAWRIWLPVAGAWGGIASVVLVATLFNGSEVGFGFTRSVALDPANFAVQNTVPQSTDKQRTSVALLQGNIEQGEKFDSSKGVPLALAWYAQQLTASTATLVVAPETAIPLLPQQLPAGYWEALQQRFATGSQAALVGVPLGTYEDGYTNSVVSFAPRTQLPGAVNVMQPQPYRYDKHHLVPFGEFTPALFKWFTRMMNIPLGDFNRGAVGQASLGWAGQRWAPNICYEDLFGDELAARFIDPATAPTVLVNMGNIGWFGNSVAIDQHLHISRMRAIELGRPMLRATNTGPTVIIDHRGQVTHNLERHTRGVLVGEVQGRSGTTLFAWWAARLGLWPLWSLGLGVLAWAWVVARRYEASEQQRRAP